MIAFLDAGAHDGSSIRLARALLGDVPIVAVEPAPEHARALSAPGVVLHRAALWTSAGTRTFYPATNGVGGTLMPEKRTGGVDLAAGFEVATVTLDRVLDDFPSACEVIAKLDIEGAEYDVLEDALRRGVLFRLAGLFVDFHADRLAGFPMERHSRLVRALLDAGFPLPKWSPVEGCIKPWGAKWLDMGSRP